MISTWAWLFFNLLIYVSATLSNGQTKAFIEITELGYEDTCYETAEAEWFFINSPSNETLSIWEEKLIAYAEYKKVQKDEVSSISKENLKDLVLQYKYDVIEKAGEALLKSEDYETLVHFIGALDSTRTSRLLGDKLKNQTRKDAERVLSHNSKIEDKNNTWVLWHQELNPLVQNFSINLPLIQEAAKANGAKDVADYWELLSGFTNGYKNIKNQWYKITNLHKKILKFGITSLSHKYGITINDTIPAYLLGSLQGNDWTAVSVDMTPHSNLMYNIKKNLWKRRLLGKSLYKTASVMGSTVLNQVPQADFWDKSQFNQQCPPKLINFCRDGITRVSTCFEPTVSNFLAAHQNVGKVLFHQMSVEAAPVLNTANRYSGLEEGVSELFGILAASPAWLNYTGVIDNSTNNDQHLIVSLMITALNVLPRISYYLSADLWRIDAIEKGITEPADLVSSWWKYRQEYEGIISNGSNVPTFLDDEYIIRNKPYLPKLVGTILAFQIYEYLMDSTEVRYDRITGKQINVEFIKMIQGSADDWMEVLNKHLQIDEISVDSLQSFFSPLEDFLEELDEDFQYTPVTAKESELDELEKKIIQEINAPTTTTTTTTTTISPTRRKMPNSMASSKQNNGGSDKNAVPTSDKNLEPKSSLHSPDVKPENQNASRSEVLTKVPFDESLIHSLENEPDGKPKINTSKAVWAVGAVLAATIIICIIAIFGRQRCRKAPKNRRYI